MDIKFFENFGVSPEFLEAIGVEKLQAFAQEVFSNPEYSAQDCYEYITPSKEPLPISGELEYLLGIPPIPKKVPEDILHLYLIARQFKYKYKMLKLAGFINPINIAATPEERINTFNGTNKSGLFVVKMLMGKFAFDLNQMMDYPFKHKEEFERTCLPPILFTD